jgi:hypothetical protein
VIRTQSSSFTHASIVFSRESEQNVHDIDQNDPIAREMSNTDILDSLEAQANNATNLDFFFRASHVKAVTCMHERYLKNCVASLHHEQLSQSPFFRKQDI